MLRRKLIGFIPRSSWQQASLSMINGIWGTTNIQEVSWWSVMPNLYKIMPLLNVKRLSRHKTTCFLCAAPNEYNWASISWQLALFYRNGWLSNNGIFKISTIRPRATFGISTSGKFTAFLSFKINSSFIGPAGLLGSSKCRFRQKAIGSRQLSSYYTVDLVAIGSYTLKQVA